MDITTLGIDLAKSVFQLHGVDAQGVIVLQKKLRRGAVVKFLSKLEPSNSCDAFARTPQAIDVWKLR
jgi:transposase